MLVNESQTPQSSEVAPALPTNSPFKSLHNKAMLVKLTCSKPTMSRRDASAEAFVQTKLSDTSLTVSSQLFKGKDNAVRKLINDASEIYTTHIASTIPWNDRGPRLLPVSAYHAYGEKMRALIRAVETKAAKLLPFYPDYVQADIAARGDRAKLEDYPSPEVFKNGFAFTLFFQPLPDTKHFLFDMDKDDLQALDNYVEAAGVEARTHVAAQMRDPLVHLIEKLKVRIGKAGSIFMQATLTNIVEACDQVDSLAMGDEELLASAAELRKAIRPYVLNPDQLRESPKARKSAVDKLEEVASKMAFMAGE